MLERPAASLHAIARALEARRIRRWVLQPFRATGCDDEALVAAVPNEAPLDVGLVDALRAYDIDVAIR